MLEEGAGKAVDSVSFKLVGCFHERVDDQQCSSYVLGGHFFTEKNASDGKLVACEAIWCPTASLNDLASYIRIPPQIPRPTA